jgi:NitT/TauT family transport system permease protein
MAISLVLPFLLWWLLSTFGSLEPVFLPSPGDIVEAWRRLWEKGFLTQDIAASVLRVGAGFLLAVWSAHPVQANQAFCA